MRRDRNSDELIVELTAAIGRRLRGARLARGWSQDLLARRSAVSAGMILQIEQGRTNPSIAVLVRLSEALNVRLAELVDDPASRSPVVRRPDDATELWNDRAGSHGRLRISGSGPDQLELWEWHLEPGASHESEAHPPGTIELLLVTEGAVTVTAGGDPHALLKGDVISFSADGDHAYANGSSDRPAAFVHVHLQPIAASPGVPASAHASTAQPDEGSQA